MSAVDKKQGPGDKGTHNTGRVWCNYCKQMGGHATHECRKRKLSESTSQPDSSEEPPTKQAKGKGKGKNKRKGK